MDDLDTGALPTFPPGFIWALRSAPTRSKARSTPTAVASPFGIASVATPAS